MNEPVAWRIKNKDGEWLYYDEELVGTEPLYTTPQAEIAELKAKFKSEFEYVENLLKERQ